MDRETSERARAEGKLIMQLDDDLYSAEDPGEDETYFMNHSCEPNVWMADTVTLVTRRCISPGEELTIDYALFEAVEDFMAEWECVCGSNSCRKRVMETLRTPRAIRRAFSATHRQAYSQKVVRTS